MIGTLYILSIILVFEFIGDFLLQSRETALNKSKEVGYLLMHLLQIAMMLIVPIAIGAHFGLFTISSGMLFVLCYCLIHGIQDWFIWNGYKWLVFRREKKKYLKDNPKKFATEPAINQQVYLKLQYFERNKEYAEDKAFYDTIGLDRLLHILTLIALYGAFLL